MLTKWRESDMMSMKRKGGFHSRKTKVEREMSLMMVPADFEGKGERSVRIILLRFGSGRILCVSTVSTHRTWSVESFNFFNQQPFSQNAIFSKCQTHCTGPKQLLVAQTFKLAPGNHSASTLVSRPVKPPVCWENPPLVSFRSHQIGSFANRHGGAAA